MLKAIDAVISLLVFFISFPIWVVVFKEYSEEKRTDFIHVFQGLCAAIATGLAWFILLPVVLIIFLLHGIAELFNAIDDRATKKENFKQEEIDKWKKK